MKKGILKIIIIVFCLFFSACTIGNSYRIRDENRNDSFRQAAVRTIKKYTRNQCSFYVKDVLGQYGIQAEGRADDIILSLKKSLDWKRCSADEANEKAGDGNIVIAARRSDKPGGAGHVCFVLYDPGYKKDGKVTVIGTYRGGETTLNYEFDLSDPHPVEFFCYRRH